MMADDAGVVIEIPASAYEAAVDAITNYYDDADEVRAVNASEDVLHAAVPIIVAAELVNLADQLTELAEYMRRSPRLVNGHKATGLVEGITVIRERAAKLQAAATSEG